MVPVREWLGALRLSRFKKFQRIFFASAPCSLKIEFDSGAITRASRYVCTGGKTMPCVPLGATNASRGLKYHERSGTLMFPKVRRALNGRLCRGMCYCTFRLWELSKTKVGRYSCLYLSDQGSVYK